MKGNINGFRQKCIFQHIILPFLGLCACMHAYAHTHALAHECGHACVCVQMCVGVRVSAYMQLRTGMQRKRKGRYYGASSLQRYTQCRTELNV